MGHFGLLYIHTVATWLCRTLVRQGYRYVYVPLSNSVYRVSQKNLCTTDKEGTDYLKTQFKLYKHHLTDAEVEMIWVYESEGV